MARFETIASTQGYIPQFAPVDYGFIQGNIDRRQQRIDQATFNLSQTKEKLGQVYAVTPQDQEYLDKMREGIKNDFKSIIQQYDGDISSASNDLTNYIGSMRNDPFWKSNEINQAQWQTYEQARQQYGDQAVQFMKPGSVTKFDETGNYLGVRSPNELIYEVEKKSDSEKIATGIYDNLQADSKFKGIDYIGYWAKFDDVKEITDQKIKDVAQQSISAFKEADPQFLRRILLDNGLYSQAGITSTQAEQMLNDKAKEEGIVFSGKIYQGKNAVDNIIKDFLVASNADRPYKQEDYKLMQNPAAIARLQAQYEQPQQYQGQSGLLQQIDPTAEYKDMLVKNKELNLSDLEASGRVIENTLIGTDPNEQDMSWLQKMAWNLMPANVNKSVAILKDFKNKQVSSLMQSKNVKGNSNDYIIMKGVDGSPILSKAPKMSHVPFEVKGGEISQDMLTFLKNRNAGDLKNAGFELKTSPDGTLEIKTLDGQSLNFDQYSAITKFMAEKINKNYKVFSPSYDNPIEIDAKGKQSVYGQDKEEEIGFKEFNEKIYGEADKDKILSTASSFLNVDMDNKNLFLVGGSNVDGKYLDNASFSDVIKNSPLPLIGFNVLGKSNNIPGVGPVDIIEARFGEQKGEAVQTVKFARPTTSASVYDYLEAGWNQVSKSYDDNDEIMIPLDNTSQTSILNSRELGSTSEYALNPQGLFVKIAPKMEGNTFIGYEVMYPTRNGLKSMNESSKQYFNNVEEAYSKFYEDYINLLNKPSK